MALRMCPHCGKTVPAARVMAFSDGMECPHCQTRLEVANGGRMIATAAGLVAEGHAEGHGEPGTGKTHLAVGVMKALIEKQHCHSRPPKRPARGTKL